MLDLSTEFTLKQVRNRFDSKVKHPRGKGKSRVRHMTKSYRLQTAKASAPCSPLLEANKGKVHEVTMYFVVEASTVLAIIMKDESGTKRAELTVENEAST